MRILALYSDLFISTLMGRGRILQRFNELLASQNDLRGTSTRLNSFEKSELLRQIPRFDRFLNKLPWARRCLTKSVAICTVLERREIPVRICLGAFGTLDDLSIHSWIEVDGRSYLRGETPFLEFTPERLPVSP